MQTKLSRSAFTLPEVVITVLLLTLMMLPITQLAFSTSRSTRYARDVGDAISIAQARLEMFEDVEYEDLVAGTSTVDGYTLRWEVEEQDLSKMVRLSITWTLLGRTQTATFNAIYPSYISAGISFQ